MKKNSLIWVRTTIAVASVLMLFACENTFKSVGKIHFSDFSPSGEADNLNMKYTDSGRITAVLVSPKMLDYATVEFPFTEFPKGIDVTLYDKAGKRTFIKSDYAVQYKGTELIDLRDNVVITSEDGKKLMTAQLYFDQKNEWFFTEKNFTFTDAGGGSTSGEGIDFSKDFKKINFQRVRGQINRTE